MRQPSRLLLRIAAVGSSLLLLAGYVVYSHITPNEQPPDLLGVNSAPAAADSLVAEPIEMMIEPEVVEFDGFINYGTSADLSASKQKVKPEDGHTSIASKPPQELRIISSKVINQPIFSVRYGPFQGKGMYRPEKKPHVSLYEFGLKLNGGLPR